MQLFFAVAFTLLVASASAQYTVCSDNCCGDATGGVCVRETGAANTVACTCLKCAATESATGAYCGANTNLRPTTPCPAASGATAPAHQCVFVRNLEVTGTGACNWKCPEAPTTPPALTCEISYSTGTLPGSVVRRCGDQPFPDCPSGTVPSLSPLCVKIEATGTTAARCSWDGACTPATRTCYTGADGTEKCGRAAPGCETGYSGTPTCCCTATNSGTPSCLWNAPCLPASGNGCTTCPATGPTCPSGSTLTTFGAAAVCIKGATNDSPCVYAESSYRCAPTTDPAPTCGPTCPDARLRVCGYGKIVDTSVAPRCVLDGSICYRVPACKPDPCFAAETNTACRCRYDNRCMYSLASGCVSTTNSDVASLVGTTFRDSAPAECSATPPPETTETRLAETVSTPTNVDSALRNFDTAVAEVQSKVDASGVRLAAQVTIIVVAIPNPTKRSDGTYEFHVTITLVVNDPSVVLTDAHAAAFCTPLRGLIKDTTRVEVTSDCTFVKRTTTKRMTLQSPQTATYDMSATAPGSSVDAIYGSSASSASTVVVAFGVALISLFVALFM